MTTHKETCSLLALVLCLLGQCLLCRCQDTNCTGLKRVTVSSGIAIVSHSGYGMTNYPSSALCYWQIDAAAADRRVTAWFTYLDGESSSDRLLLLDGTNNSAVIATVNGTGATKASPVYVTSGSSMTLFFYTGSDSGSHKGFRVQLSSVANPVTNACRFISFTDSSNSTGTLTSHEGFGSVPYPKNLTCSWTLPQIYGRFIQLSAMNISLGDGDCLRVTPIGSSTGGSPTTAYCGWTAFANLSLQMGENLRIDFTSNSWSESTGFSLQLDYLPFCPSNLQINSSGEGGEIVSHSGVGVSNYWTNMNCNWQINPPPGMQVMFRLTYISLSYYDYGYVYDLRTGSSILNYNYGNSGPSSVYSSTSGIRVNFVSDNSYIALGFRLQYNITKLYCNGFINLTAGAGEIVSHLTVGSTPYLPNANCYWQLNAPAGRRVAVWLTYNSIYCCGADRMSFYDGVNGSSVIASGTNNFAATKYVSSSNTLTVYFYSDPSTSKWNGFLLRYEAVDNYTSTGCAPINYTSSTSGVIVSQANYGSIVYPPNLNCSWTLPQLPGYYMNLQVTFQLAIGDCLRLTSNATSGSSPNTTYCGWSSNSVNMVMAGSAQIAFTSDALYESYGFSVRFDYAYPCPSLQALTADSGEIQSHTGAGTLMYLNNMQCNWLISVSPGKQVIAWLTLYSMNDGGDYVTLYDGISGTNSLVSFRYSANTMQGFTSSSNFMRVSFVSDSSGTALGFKLSYSTADNFCPSQQTLTGSGEIVSHSGYGVTNCLSYRQCSWQITAPADNNVVARFTFFSLDPTVSDYVYLYDSVSGSSQIGYLRGIYNDSTATFISNSNGMRVQFVTNNLGNSLGFRMEFNTSESYCRGNKITSGDSGEVVSHSSVGYRRIPSGTNCFWLITVPAGKRVIASFTYLSLNSSDNIYVIDGVYGMTQLASLNYLSGPSSSALLTSGNVLSFGFQASSGASYGFRMGFNATDSYCSRYLLIQGGSGEISSHSDAGVSQYLNNMVCTWQIIGNQFTQILASFKLLDLNSAGDTVTLLDGPSENPVITVRGGSASLVPKSILTITNILTVRFATDASGSGLGFRLSYNAGSESSTLSPSTTRLTMTIATSEDERPTTTIVGRLTNTTGYQNSPEAQSQTPMDSSILTIAIAIAVPLVVLSVAAGLVGYFVQKHRHPTQAPAEAAPKSVESRKSPRTRSNYYSQKTELSEASTNEVQPPNTTGHPYVYANRSGKPEQPAEQEYDLIG